MLANKLISGAGGVGITNGVYSCTGAAYVGTSGALTGLPGSGIARSIAFNATGTVMYVAGYASNDIMAYSLSVPWAVTSLNTTPTTIDLSGSLPAEGGSLDLVSIAFNDDGTTLYVANAVSDLIYQFTLSTAYDVSTFVLAAGTVATGIGSVAMICFSNDGVNLATISRTAQVVAQYSLTTPWDISTAGTSDGSLDTGGGPSNGIIRGAGEYYYEDAQTTTVYLRSLDVTNSVIGGVTADSSFSVASQFTGTIGGITLSPDGKSIYVADGSTASAEIYQYTLGAKVN